MCVKPTYKCRECDTELNENNWRSFQRKDSGAPWNSYICNICSNINQQERRKNRRLLILKEYGNTCVCCGYSDLVGLDIDHINNDGHIDRDESSDVYLKIIRENFPKNQYQILCKNCNRIKMMLGGKPCNCKDLSSREIVIPITKRKSKNVNVKNTTDVKCSSCEVRLTDENWLKKLRYDNPRKCICKECYNTRQSIGCLKRRKLVLEQYGQKCFLCNYDHPLCLELDHLNNDGSIQRKVFNIKDNYRDAIKLNYPKDKYQVLCSICNYTKFLELKKTK